MLCTLHFAVQCVFRSEYCQKQVTKQLYWSCVDSEKERQTFQLSPQRPLVLESTLFSLSVTELHPKANVFIYVHKAKLEECTLLRSPNPA